MNPVVAAYVSILVTVAALFPTLAYMFRYRKVSKGAWKNSRTGHHLMTFAGVIAALLMWILFNNVWLLVTGSSWAWRSVVGMLLYSTFAFTLWRQWLVFEQAQKSDEVDHVQ